MFEGSLLGEGGARNTAGCGLGARLLAGEKCCWRVENAGLLKCSTCAGAFDSVIELRFDGGARIVDVELERVDVDRVRECPG